MSDVVLSGRHRKKDPGSSAVIITAGGSPGAFDLVRSLRLEGVTSAVFSSDPRDIAVFSRACTRAIGLPAFTQENYPRILSILVAYAQSRHERPVLYYASDPELKFVLTFRHELSDHFRFLLPPEGLCEAMLNKVLFYRLGEQVGLPIPTSVFCRNIGDVAAQMEKIPFPCIVKPALSEDWNWKTDDLWEKFGPYKSALQKFSSAEALMEFCRGLPETEDGFVIQQYIEGRDETIFSFHGYFDENSECLAWFIGRKIRTYPMHTGGSTYIRTLCEPRLGELSIEMLRRLGFCGIVKIDFKKDPETGEYCIFEVNARYNLWELLGAYAGVNLAAIAYRHQRNEPLPRQRGFDSDARLLYAKQDLRSFLKGYRKTKEWTIASYARSFRGKLLFRVWDPVDPLPFVVSVASFIARNIRRMVRRPLPHKPETRGSSLSAGGSRTTKAMELMQHPSGIE